MLDFLSYYKNDEIQETLASNNSLEVTARVNHWKWRSGFVAPSIIIVSLQAQNKIPCPLLQALRLCSHDQEPGWLYSFPSCCPSLPMFCSSDTGLFAVPLTRVHPPAQGVSFCFSAHNALPSDTHVVSQRRALLWPSYLIGTLQSFPIPNHAFSSLISDFSAYITCYMFVCYLCPFSTKECNTCEVRDLFSSRLYSWCLELCLEWGQNSSQLANSYIWLSGAVLSTWPTFTHWILSTLQLPYSAKQEAKAYAG